MHRETTREQNERDHHEPDQRADQKAEEQCEPVLAAAQILDQTGDPRGPGRTNTVAFGQTRRFSRHTACSTFHSARQYGVPPLLD